jgi:hypothetical protein
MRPIHNTGSMVGAQIPGTQYFGTNPSEAYKEGHDRTFGVGEEVTRIEAGAAEAEEPKPVEPERRVRKPAKPATHKKGGKRTRAPNRNAPKVTALACGKMMGPSGRHFHVAKCDICKAAAKE